MEYPATFKLAKSIASGVFKIGYNLELVPGDSDRQRSRAFAVAYLPPILAMHDDIYNQAGDTHYAG
jgi:hypothetical protein